MADQGACLGRGRREARASLEQLPDRRAPRPLRARATGRGGARACLPVPGGCQRRRGRHRRPARGPRALRPAGHGSQAVGSPRPGSRPCPSRPSSVVAVGASQRRSIATRTARPSGACWRGSRPSRTPWTRRGGRGHRRALRHRSHQRRRPRPRRPGRPPGGPSARRVRTTASSTPAGALTRLERKGVHSMRTFVVTLLATVLVVSWVSLTPASAEAGWGGRLVHLRRRLDDDPFVR